MGARFPYACFSFIYLYNLLNNFYREYSTNYVYDNNFLIHIYITKKNLLKNFKIKKNKINKENDKYIKNIKLLSTHKYIIFQTTIIGNNINDNIEDKIIFNNIIYNLKSIIIHHNNHFFTYNKYKNN